MVYLSEIACFLDQQLGGDHPEGDTALHRIPNDPNGIYRSSERPIRRMGFALEPWAGLAEWVEREHLDALFLHRPWMLEADSFNSDIGLDIGIVAYHLAFDERFTLSFNPDLAAALEITGLEVIGKKDDRPIGMIGEVPTQELAHFCQRLRQTFGGLEKIHACEGNVSRVAVVGAMNDALVREANDRGVQLYVTGQFRQPAELAVEETAIAVVAVGHHRSEVWGLRTLARLFAEQWPNLEVCLPPDERVEGERRRDRCPPFDCGVGTSLCH